MATPSQVAAVAACHHTFTDRDVDGFVTHLTDDAILRPSTLIAGGEEYRGAEDVRAGFAEIAKLLESRGEDVTVEPLHFYVDRADETGSPRMPGSPSPGRVTSPMRRTSSISGRWTVTRSPSSMHCSTSSPG
jgi:ketosteroid isomerase-like protein